MAGITRIALGDSEDGADFADHGDAAAAAIGDAIVWRSRLKPGWSWDDDIKPFAEGAQSCPMYHHEYVVAGRIRYLMDDGTELVAEPDDVLFIEPGHRAWVVGDEPCVLVDW